MPPASWYGYHFESSYLVLEFACPYMNQCRRLGFLVTVQKENIEFLQNGTDKKYNLYPKG
jgi:hypothetical protein